MARFERRHGTVTTVAAVVAIFSAALSWSGQLGFQNNILTSILTLVGLTGIIGRAIVSTLARWYSPVGFTVPLEFLPENPDRKELPSFGYVRPSLDNLEPAGRTSTLRGLNPYVDLSVEEIEIAGAHPDLTPTQRSKLYERWLRANSLSFMSLERKSAPWSEWNVIAVSIILPLKSSAKSKFCAGEVDVLGLNEYYISPTGEPSTNLLIDTMIVKPAYRAKNEGYAFPGLLLRHLAEFWDGSSLCLLVAPDSTKLIEKLLKPLKFLEPIREGCSSALFEVHYPEDLYSLRILQRYKELAKNVVASRKWSVYQL